MSLVKAFKQFMAGPALEQSFGAYESESVQDTADFNSMVKEAARNHEIEVDPMQKGTRTIKKNVVQPAPTEFSDEELKQDHILRYFHYKHLPPVLQERSRPFVELARMLIDTTPRNSERTVALRKLLEAKDAAVRACV